MSKCRTKKRADRTYNLSLAMRGQHGFSYKTPLKILTFKT